MENASNQKLEICESRSGKNCTVWSQEIRRCVKAHRTKKENKNMSRLEKFVTERNEKADELAKQGAMLDKGFMAEARAKTMQQEREEVWKNGKTVMSSNRSRKKSRFLWTRKRKRSIEQSGVQKRKSIDA